MVKTKFKVYEDPGHSWTAVPVRLLTILGIKYKISNFSYISKNGANAYLEEDSDAPLFIETYKKKYNKSPELKFLISNKNSKIRKYIHYPYGGNRF